MCIKTIENEKTTLVTACKDFNINDAFKVLLYGVKSYPQNKEIGIMGSTKKSSTLPVKSL